MKSLGLFSNALCIELPTFSVVHAVFITKKYPHLRATFPPVRGFALAGIRINAALTFLDSEILFIVVTVKSYEDFSVAHTDFGLHD